MLLTDLFLTSFCCSSCFSPFCGSPWQPKLVLLHPSFISEKWNSKYWHVQDKFIYVISLLFHFDLKLCFHSTLSQWRDRHNAIVLMTEYRKLSSVISYAISSNDETHLKTWFMFHYKIRFFSKCVSFPVCLLKDYTLICFWLWCRSVLRQMNLKDVAYCWSYCIYVKELCISSYLSLFLLYT